MKRIVTLICLFVLTLGVAQAYSPPEEFNDQVTYELATEVDLVAEVVIAPDFIHKTTVADLSISTFRLSNIGEDIDLAVCQVDAEKDDGYIQFKQAINNREIANSQSNASRPSLRKRVRAKSLYLDRSESKSLAVPWQRFSLGSLVATHFLE